MEHVELVVLFLLVAVAVLTALARVLDVPYPILLVLGGSLVGFAPGVPHIELEPDLVLLIFLPPPAAAPGGSAWSAAGPGSAAPSRWRRRWRRRSASPSAGC
jgi:hypothetical protein